MAGIMEKCDLSNLEISRFSRQLILPNFGSQGQTALQKSRVLIVGCGGLGCPAAIYLAAAGVGTLGLVDHDVVDVSNLHRQVLHKEERVSVSKVLSVAYECERLNSLVSINAYPVQLSSANALAIVEKYDVVLDCSDNVATRYLVNDACVLTGRPLVSGSALRLEGQLTVYHHTAGPCYRCLFPRPVPAGLVTNCAEGGVLGPVPGTIGTLQAMETLKILTGCGETYAGRLLVFDAETGDFLTLKLQPRNRQCAVCGDEPSVRSLVDYVQFCGAAPDDKDRVVDTVAAKHRISVQEYKEMMDGAAAHTLIDVRPEHEFEICRLRHSINIPLTKLSKETLNAAIAKDGRPSNQQVVLLCRRGVESQLAVKKMLEELKDSPVVIRDIIGGLHRWAAVVDKSFPVY